MKDSERTKERVDRLGALIGGLQRPDAGQAMPPGGHCVAALCPLFIDNLLIKGWLLTVFAFAAKTTPMNSLCKNDFVMHALCEGFSVKMGLCQTRYLLC